MRHLRRRHPSVWMLCFAVLYAGCESDLPSQTPSGNRPPVVKAATITPEPLLLSGPALVQVDIEDPDQDPLTFRCQWYADDHPLAGQTESKLDTKQLSRGMQVWVEVVASDGRSESRPFRTKTVLVENTPPEVRMIAAEIPEPKPGDRVKLKIESFDADDDTIEYTYRWWRNTTLVMEGDQAELDTVGYTRGETIVVEVTPHDRTGAGRPLMSEAIPIANAAPTITSVPPTQVAQGRYHYLVTAADADHDPLTYTLEKAPTGMTIDKSSGLIQWQLTTGMAGSYQVRVLVEDGQKGQAFQEFDLSVPTPIRSSS